MVAQGQKKDGKRPKVSISLPSQKILNHHQKQSAFVIFGVAPPYRAHAQPKDLPVLGSHANLKQRDLLSRAWLFNISPWWTFVPGQVGHKKRCTALPNRCFLHVGMRFGWVWLGFRELRSALARVPGPKRTQMNPSFCPHPDPDPIWPRHHYLPSLHLLWNPPAQN